MKGRPGCSFIYTYSTLKGLKDLAWGQADVASAPQVSSKEVGGTQASAIGDSGSADGAGCVASDGHRFAAGGEDRPWDGQHTGGRLDHYLGWWDLVDARWDNSGEGAQTARGCSQGGGTVAIAETTQGKVPSSKGSRPR